MRRFSMWAAAVRSVVGLAWLMVVSGSGVYTAKGDEKGPVLKQTRVKAFSEKEVPALADQAGVVRQLQHLQQPFTADQAALVQDVASPRALADAYVRKVAPLFRLGNEAVETLARAPERAELAADQGTQLKFVREKQLGGATVVSYVQTYRGIPVWQGGVAVTVLDRPLRVTSATNSTFDAIEAAPPAADLIKAMGQVQPGRLAEALGVAANAQAVQPTINVVRPFYYRYDPAQRIDPEVKANQGKRGLEGPPPTLPLPPVPEAIQPGRFRLVNEVLFSLPIENEGVINWRSLVDIETGAVLYLRAGVAHATGMVYLQDPITTTGANPPTSPVAALDALRTTVTFVGLAPPAGPGPNQSLVGEFVQLTERDPPPVVPPSQPTPFEFNGSVSTDMFAAANGYHNTDRLFRLVQSMGITVSDYFDGTTFPVLVDHRGFGGAVNARAPINATWTGSDGFIFGVAAAGSGIGIAADWRVVLHEFGHSMLEDSVHSPNFGFAHSAGDSMAVILNDPGSHSPDRFVSFPWVNIGRRHDRPVAGGWGWGGTHDVGGYSSEQILSTMLFRVYRTIGGDAPWPGHQRFASRYAATLIVRGIGLLATDPVTPTPVPDIFEAAMMNADQGTASIEGHPGGAVHKVIRWAFEKQGLHRDNGQPPTSEGAPSVDVYIDDGRAGEYLPFLPNFWETTDIWNRHSPDGGLTHETPFLGVANFIYVRVKNRGTQAANNVRVRAFHNRPGTGLLWPGDWQPTATTILPAPGAPAISIAPGTTAVFGPFEWTPAIPGHECLLASVSADGDMSNIDPASVSPANTGPTPHWLLVPHDNNIAQRNVAPVPGGGGLRGLASAFRDRRITVYNPYTHRVRARVEIELPKPLAERGWKGAISGIDNQPILLGPLERTQVRIALQPGKDFSREDISQIRGGAKIVVRSYTDDLAVGGMTYVLDPEMKAPAPEGPVVRANAGEAEEGLVGSDAGVVPKTPKP